MPAYAPQKKRRPNEIIPRSSILFKALRQNHKFRHFPTASFSRHSRSKMFYFIGLGLADEKDITVKGLEIVQRAERVYLEGYTAILMVNKERLVC